MAVLLDSASVDDAAAAAELGFVHGITTNPALMARETSEPLAHLGRLLAAFPGGPICYQPTRTSYSDMGDEARAAAALAPDRVVVKLPATFDAIRLAASLADGGIRCALTAVYSPAQALLAHEAGCVWVHPVRRQGGEAFGRGGRRRAGGDPGVPGKRHADPRRQPQERPAGRRLHPAGRPRHHSPPRGHPWPCGPPPDRVRRTRVRRRLDAGAAGRPAGVAPRGGFRRARERRGQPLRPQRLYRLPAAPARAGIHPQRLTAAPAVRRDKDSAGTPSRHRGGHLAARPGRTAPVRRLSGPEPQPSSGAVRPRAGERVLSCATPRAPDPGSSDQRGDAGGLREARSALHQQIRRAGRPGAGRPEPACPPPRRAPECPLAALGPGARSHHRHRPGRFPLRGATRSRSSANRRTRH